MPDVLRELFLQRAPLADVVAQALATEGWPSLDAQETVAAATVSKSVGSRYRRSFLKALMQALGAREEVHEELLAAHLEGVSTTDSEAVATLSFELPGCENQLTLTVTDHIGGGTETGGMLWPASLLLAAWLLQPTVAPTLAGARVLELGSGVGMLGLALARAIPVECITMTDFVTMTLDNLQRNAQQLDGCELERVRVRQLDWNEPDSARRAELAVGGASPGHLDWSEAASPSVTGFDLTLAADVVYDPSALPALVSTLAESLKGGICRSVDCSNDAQRPCRALVCSERRSEETWSVFEALLAKHDLHSRDLSEEARAVSAAQTRFFCPRETRDRMVLIELTAPGISPKRIAQDQAC